jgi:ADP-heptose:LPS heptosyltransferase
VRGVEIDWSHVTRVLVVRLRSIGDGVLTTPSLIALRRFLPNAQIDILLEDWVAPVLDGFDAVDDVLTVDDSNWSRLGTARQIRRRKYDVVFNLHGGTTATFFTFATGARHRVGYGHYRYSFLHNRLISSSADFWKKRELHSAEQHLALLGAVGVPVEYRPRSRLVPTVDAIKSLEDKFESRARLSLSELGGFALFHPAAAFETKQWPAEKFALTAEFLRTKDLRVVAVVAKGEGRVLERLQTASSVPIVSFDDLTLPEITALASKARLFLGNESGIAHMAAAVGTPSVVIFGSSNRDHWRPWTDAPNEIVFDESGDPGCILNVKPDQVFRAIDRVLS